MLMKQVVGFAVFQKGLHDHVLGLYRLRWTHVHTWTDCGADILLVLTVYTNFFFQDLDSFFFKIFPAQPRENSLAKILCTVTTCRHTTFVCGKYDIFVRCW